MNQSPTELVAPRVRAREIFALAGCAALITALIHVAIFEFRFRVLDTFTWTGRQFAWLSPLGYLLLFGVLALGLALAAWLLPRVVTRPIAAAAVFALALFALLSLYQRIAALALLALAVGAGARLGWMCGARWTSTLRWAKRLTPITAGVLVAAGFATGGARRFMSHTRLSDAAAAPPGAPNVILLILDTVRAANLSIYGYSRPTSPTLERVAARGVVFDHAFSTASWTAPSHASMMTGRWGGESRADYLSPMDPTAPTLAEALSRHGYATGAFIANTGYASYQVGFDRGFAHYEDLPVDLPQVLWSTTLARTRFARKIQEAFRERAWWKIRGAITDFDLRIDNELEARRQHAAEIADHFLAWRGRVSSGPYFAMLNLMDAHAPYNPPDGFSTRFGDGGRALDRYDGGIAYADSVLGSLLDRLERMGDLENTIIVVTADHGEQWGEHGLDSHGNSLYLPLLHVPLIVAGTSAVPAGQRVAPLVSLRDLPATILELARVSGHQLPGQSLSIVWRMGQADRLSPIVAEASLKKNARPTDLTSRGTIRTIIDSTWHFIRYGDGQESLYAWRDDRGETNDLRASAQGARQSDRLRAELAHILQIELGSGR